MLARRTGRSFHLRVEDLDRVREGAEQRQIEDLAALGIDWDGEVVRQSERGQAHEAAVQSLSAQGMVFECYCTRREILEAPSAPHAPPGAYPGTCRDLSPAQRDQGRRRMHELRREPALRLRAGVDSWQVRDLWAGEVTGAVDDLVLRRGDGVVAYNLAVVVDDAAAGVDQGWCARTTCSAPRPDRPTSRTCWSCPSPGTRTSRSRWAPPARAWPSATAR